MMKLRFPRKLPSQGDGAQRRAESIRTLARLIKSGWQDSDLIVELEVRGFKSRTASEYVRIANNGLGRKPEELKASHMRRKARGGKHPENPAAFKAEP